MQGPGTPSSARVPDDARQAAAGTGHLRNDYYIFASARQRVVGYNALLQGGFQPSEYVIASADLMRSVTEYQIGATILWRFGSHDFGIAYAPITGRTKEFRGRFERAHKWGTIQFSWE